MDMALFADMSGWFGAAAVLVGYAAFSLGWIGGERLFQGLNLLGSGALIVNGSYYGAWPFVALNCTWGTISALALIRAARARRRAVTAADGAWAAGLSTAPTRAARAESLGSEE